MLSIADAMGAAGVRTRRPILFVATTGEEGSGNLRGARHLFATVAADAHAAIALDGAGDERIVTHALGTRRYRIAFTGPGGHSWASYGVANAVHAVADLAARIAAWPLPVRPPHRTHRQPHRRRVGDQRHSRRRLAGDRPALDFGGGTRSARRRDRRRGPAGARPAQPAAPPRVAAVAAVDRGHRRSPGRGDRGRRLSRPCRLRRHAPRGTHPRQRDRVDRCQHPLASGHPGDRGRAPAGAGATCTPPREWFENRDGSLGLVRAMTVLTAAAELA